MLLLVAAAWALLRLAIDMPYGRFGLGEAFVPLGLLTGGLLLAPMAWQWSGEEGPLAPMLRGLLQSLLWNALWLILLVFAFGAMADAEQPAPQPPARAGVPAPPQVPPRWRESASKWPKGEAGQDATRKPPSPPLSPELQLFSMGLLLSTVLGRVLAERETVEAREAALQVETEKAQSLALQAQMQPHALFNALSGLVELAQEDPEATELALIALCDYLRRLMDHARAEATPLRKERELLEGYLRIEQLRLGDCLAVAWEWPAWADSLVLPPLLLQPLVENAILHGISTTPEGGKLRISVSREQGNILLRVDNTGQPPPPAQESLRKGMGLGHLSQRLALWAGTEAEAHLSREGDWTRAWVQLAEGRAR